MMGLETLNNPYLGADTSLSCSAETSAKIDGEVLSIIKEAHEKALRILEENKEKLHELAAFLLEKETITGVEFMEILTGKPAEEKEEATAAAPVTAEAEPTI